MSKIYKIIKVISSTEIVVNVGEEQINKSDEFLVYSLDEELFDPDTNESLGQLETIKGTVTPSHIQNKITTLKSNTTYTLKEAVVEKTTTLTSELSSLQKNLGSLWGNADKKEVTTEKIIKPAIVSIKPLSNVKVGNFIKKIN